MDLRAPWEGNVSALSSPATWTQAGVPLALGVGFAVAKNTDQAVANALGVGVRIVTMRAVDTAGRSPAPLDRLDVAGELLTIDYVTPVVLSGVVYGWRCYCAGAGLRP